MVTEIYAIKKNTLNNSIETEIQYQNNTKNNYLKKFKSNVHPPRKKYIQPKILNVSKQSLRNAHTIFLVKDQNSTETQKEVI